MPDLVSVILKERNEMTTFFSEPFEAYNKARKQFLSSHQLADFRKCPLLYKRKKDGLIEEPDRVAFQIGRAAHCLVLEGVDEFHQRYAVGGPINEKTGKYFGKLTKAYAEWEATQGRPCIDIETYDLLKKLEESFRSHQLARSLVEVGNPELVGRAKYLDVDCQIRMDWFGPAGIIDYKTCDDLTWFESDARRYGYAHQLAFYRGVAEAVTGKVYPVYLVASEKSEPFRTGVWQLSPSLIERATQDNIEAMNRLAHFAKTGAWPTNYEDLRFFDWM